MGGAEGAPDASRRNEQADKHAPAIEIIGDERIAAGAKFPGADFRFADPFGGIAGEDVMQIMERDGALAAGNIREFERDTENADSERRRGVLLDAEAVGDEI